MDPGGLDAQRPQADLVSTTTSGHAAPPPHRTSLLQDHPHSTATSHRPSLPPPTHTSAGHGHVSAAGSSGPSRRLPPPTSASSGVSDSLPRQGQAQSVAGYHRSYSVDSGHQRTHQSQGPSGGEPPHTFTAHPPTSAGMAHSTPHTPVYPDHPPPNGYGQHAMPLMSHPDRYQQPMSNPAPMHHPHYLPQFSAGPAQYQPSPSYESSQIRQRKAVRAQQACQQCRQRKQKCDEGRPRCGFCEKENMSCEYKETQPPKSDRSINEILIKLTRIEEGQNTIKDNQDVLARRLDNLEFPRVGERKRPLHAASSVSRRTISPTSASASGGALDYSDDRMDEDSEETETALHSAPSETALHSARSDTAPTKDMAAPLPYSNYQYPHEMHDTISAQLNGEEHPSAGGIPSDHRTSVTHLSTWPGIKELYASVKLESRRSITEYEKGQGLLRVWGVGQNGDRLDDRRVDYPAASPASDSSDPSEPEGLWGSNQLDGSLRLDEGTVRRLYDSYVKHFHIMLPFLDRSRIQKMLIMFIERYSGSSDPSAAPLSDPMSHMGSKRTGSSHLSTPQSETSIPTPDYGKDVPEPQRPIEKSVTNAVILLIMALGKVAEHKDYLRGPAKPGENPPPVYGQTSPLGATSPLSGVKPSPISSHTPASSIQSPVGSDHRSDFIGRSQHHPDLTSRLQMRNIDVFPGLAYYATATDILDYYVRSNSTAGDLIGRHLHLIWGFVLAALYMGQLCRPLESYTWIYNACTAWIRMNSSFPELKQRLEAHASPDKDADLAKLAYWTCLQLESDIRAELDFEKTNIGEYEHRVSFPIGITDDIGREKLREPHNKDVFFFTLQISLRKTLNRTHSYVYGAEPKNIKELLEELNGFRANVMSMHMSPVGLRNWKDGSWKDGSDPATDLNVARVLGKFYGAQYIVLRPYLQHAMNDFSAVPEELRYYVDIELGGPNAEVVFKDIPRIDPQNRSVDYLKQIIGATFLCVRSAMNSTMAFDGLGSKRFIVTNIHGTAVAQFGNVLVLCAAYFSWLGPSDANIVSKKRLLQLLDRTINLMYNLAQLSDCMRDNEKILRAARQRIENTGDNDMGYGARSLQGIQSAHSSFGP